MNKVIFALISLPLLAQAKPNSVPTPQVINGSFFQYPPIARGAGVSGVVVIEVTTDGRRVVSTKVTAGPPLLTKSAVDYVQSWQFAPHPPTRFNTTFKFAIIRVNCDTRDDSDHGEVVLRLPRLVEATTSIPIECDPVVTNDATHSN